MQALQRAIQQIAQQLRDLSASSKLLVGSLLIILVMALFIVSLYTGRSAMVPLPVSLTSTNRTTVVQYLDGHDIKWSERAGQIVVPVEKRHLVLAQLTDEAIISPDEIDFDALIQQDSPFLSKSQNDRRWLVATMNQLSRTISRLKGIDRVDVVIDEPSRPQGLGRSHVPWSASVNVVTSGGPIEQHQVNAIAEMVAGAVAELKPAQVAVIDASAGRVHHAIDRERADAGQYLDLQQRTTNVYQKKLTGALSYIAGVNIAVNVIVDHREVVEQSRRYEDPKQGVVRESSRTMDSTNQMAGAEPGVRSNTGASISGPARRTSSVTDERADTSMVPAFGDTNSRTRDPGGYALKINASIGVPRSYFVSLFRERQGDAAVEPTPADLQPVIDGETTRIRDHVQPLIDTGPRGGPAVGTVAVTVIPDVAVQVVNNDGISSVGGSGAGLVSDTMVKYLSLGGLALLSVVMMIMMVRKATVQQELPSVEELVGLPRVLTEEDAKVIGESEISLPPLEGVEVDEDSLRNQQKLDQLNEMAQESPTETAKLLKKWLREGNK